MAIQVQLWSCYLVSLLFIVLASAAAHFLDTALMHSALSAFIDFLVEVYASCSLGLERECLPRGHDALKMPDIRYAK